MLQIAPGSDIAGFFFVTEAILILTAFEGTKILRTVNKHQHPIYWFSGGFCIVCMVLTSIAMVLLAEGWV